MLCCDPELLRIVIEPPVQTQPHAVSMLSIELKLTVAALIVLPAKAMPTVLLDGIVTVPPSTFASVEVCVWLDGDLF